MNNYFQVPFLNGSGYRIHPGLKPPLEFRTRKPQTVPPLSLSQVSSLFPFFYFLKPLTAAAAKSLSLSLSTLTEGFQVLSLILPSPLRSFLKPLSSLDRASRHEPRSDHSLISLLSPIWKGISVCSYLPYPDSIVTSCFLLKQRRQLH